MRWRLALVVFGLFMALAALVGLSIIPVPGLADVAVEYRVSGEPKLTPDALKHAVTTRLSAGRVAADVTATEGALRLVVDRPTLPAVEELLRWQGGVALYEADENLRPTLVDRPDRVQDAVEHAASTEIRQLFEPLGPTLAQMRPVRAEPLVNLDAQSFERVDVDAAGTAVRIQLDERGRTLLAALPAGERSAGRTVLAVRDRTVLGPVVDRREDGFSIPVGTGLYAYTRADRVRTLLATPGLPTLERVGKTDLPASLALALFGLVLPIALSFAWLTFVRRFDRLHPEPLWLVTVVFGLGVLSVVPAALLELGFAKLSLALNPAFASMGGRVSALPYSIVVFSLVVGLSEEGAKLLAALVVRRRREFDEPIDGIVYGVAAALGFAAAENVKYFATGRLAPSLVIARTFTSIPAHLFFGAIWGFALGQTLLPRHGRFIVLRYLVLAAVLHGTFDALLSTRTLAPIALLVNFLSASIFIAVIRKALRRGAVDRDTAPLSVERETVVRVGSPFLFWLSAGGVHLGALAMVIVGVSYESAATRPGVGFFVGAGLALAILVGSAWALSATLPLDVVVDVNGVTFAGSLRRWEHIERVDRVGSGSMNYLRIASSEGDLRVGPIAKRAVAGLEMLFSSRIATEHARVN